MNTMTKTYSQLTDILKIYLDRKLNPYHPLIKLLIKYEDVLNELSETQDDLQYAKDRGDMEEEVEDLIEVVEELERMKTRQWRHMMESFVVNAYYHPYRG
jgi:hypothetical protein